MKTLLLTLILGAAALRAEDACGKLAQWKAAGVTVTSAATETSDIPMGPNRQPMSLAPRCRVKVTARPTSDSEIRFELWMPVDGWNGKYEQAGNGGWAGAIPVESIAHAVKRGYAAAGTDDGHSGGGGADWAIGHPEKLIDFGYRALHETAIHAKQLIRTYYGKDAERAYFFGCSDGGREALMEAQRYPEDFHGIIAGAPANDWSNLAAGLIWDELALLSEPGSALAMDQLPIIERAVLDACDTLDGVKDGLLEDPRRCRFDPGVLTCKDGQSAGCLTPQQVAALRKIYAGPRDVQSGAMISPGYSPGTEGAPASWPGWIVAAPPEKAIQFFFANSFYGQAVHERTKWDFRSFDWARDVALGNGKAGSVIDSTNPDLRSFRAHGGKLIHYHGWGDAAIPGVSSISYYEKVRAFLATYSDPRSGAPDSIQDFYRLFMVPGMGHCAGGYGPNNFGNTLTPVQKDAENDVLTALETWVEKGTPPARLIGTGKTRDGSKPLTRPLCPYPQTAKYDGKGDPNSAASFTCAAP
jgi:feruloyl esterase